MATAEQRQMIIQYWMRKSLSNSLSVDDITKIMVKFGDEYEEFDSLVSSKTIHIINDALTVRFLNNAEAEDDTLSAFGIMNATPGRKYLWKMKIGENSNGNIGIIEADKCQSVKDKDSANAHDANGVAAKYWWGRSYGYSYYMSNGETFHDGDYNLYGPAINKHDIIQICLDLKEENALSYILNKEDLGKAYNVKDNTIYKLAIGLLYEGEVDLISFEVLD